MFKLNTSLVYLFSMLLSVLSFSNSVFAANGNISNTDPTRPFTGHKSLGGIATKKHELVLQSIIEQGSQRKAIINGKILKKGEHINGYQVMKINSKNVTLKSAQRSLKLSLFTKVLSK